MTLIPDAACRNGVHQNIRCNVCLISLNKAAVNDNIISEMYNVLKG